MISGKSNDYEAPDVVMAWLINYIHLKNIDFLFSATQKIAFAYVQIHIFFKLFIQ
jgi:hypothetical protein